MIPDPPRQWARPRYETALAIHASVQLPGTSYSFEDENALTQKLMLTYAQAAIDTLIRHGFVNPQFFDALKAEQAGENEGGESG